MAQNDKKYREMLKSNMIRLFLTYILPFIVLIIYFEVQYNSLIRNNNKQHLKSIAEIQAKSLDLYLNEKLIDLASFSENQLSWPFYDIPIEQKLEKLKSYSSAFVDLGICSPTGRLISYAGEYHKGSDDLSGEEWYNKIKDVEKRYRITSVSRDDNRPPFFTIAAKHNFGDSLFIVYAKLDPRQIYKNIQSVDGAKDVITSIINSRGIFQLSPFVEGDTLRFANIKPDQNKRIGVKELKREGRDLVYAFAWLNSADWAVIAQSTDERADQILNMQLEMMIISILLVIIFLITIYFRARKIVRIEKEKDFAHSQLAQAAKLASVGELASGIAHEINNPLAIITSEAGLMKDLMSPEFKQNTSFEDLIPHLDNIHHAAFRARDITRKLLSFVRVTEIRIQPHDVNEIIEEIFEGFYKREASTSNIEIEKKFGELPKLHTDENQLRQVLLNIINNSLDAIQPPGKITCRTWVKDNMIHISVTDTGKGISSEEIDKIFMPFYTTKDVGKGTGLGLSVSYSIIKNLGGDIDVDSALGEGTTFIIKLPVKT
ncbi:MAG: sensor histidine kinase [Bacteroidota bacterium]